MMVGEAIFPEGPGGGGTLLSAACVVRVGRESEGESA